MSSPSVEVIDRRFARFVLSNAGLERLTEGLRWTEGPVWMGDWGCLLFQDLPSDRTLRWTPAPGGVPGGAVTTYRAPSGHANGQTRDGEGRLISCSHRHRCLLRTERSGRVTRLAERHGGLRLNAPNDVALHPDGSIWFTDPLYGIQSDYEGGRGESEQPPAVYRLAPGEDEPRAMATDFAGPNGIAFDASGRRLYVAETGDQTHDGPEQLIRAFDVDEDGRLTGGDAFHKIEPGYCDGLAVDEEGFVWSSAADGVHCLDPAGALMGKILTPGRVSNLCFGEVALDRLFLCGEGTLHAIFLNRRGAWPS